MASQLTLMQILALSGLIKSNSMTNTNVEEGLAISSQLVNFVNDFGGTGLSSASQRCINNNGPLVTAAVKQLPSFITGYLDSAQRSIIPASITISGNNLLNDLLEQAQSLTKNGVMGLVDHIQGSYVFCVNSYESLSLLYTARQKSIQNKDLGFLFDTMDDIMTMGMTNQFGNLGSQAYQELCKNISNFGNLFDHRDLSRCFTPASLIKQLFSLGYNRIIADALNSENISVKNYADVYDKVLIQVLNKVTATQVANIVNATGFKSGSSLPLTRLGDLFDVNFLLGSNARTIVSSLPALQDKLVAVFGISPRINSLGALGQAMSKFRQPMLEHLPVLATDSQAYAEAFSLEGLEQTLGQGSGVFNNPTMGDVLGSFVGFKYNQSLETLLEVHEQLLTYPEGQSLMAALNTAYQQRYSSQSDSTSAQLITNSAKSLMTSGNANIVEGLNTASAEFNRILNLLINEKVNQRLANIDPNNTLGSAAQSAAFVSELSGLHDNSNGLGYGDFVRAACANNKYGEAIRSVIDEGYNHDIMRDLAVEVSNTIDPSPTVQELQTNQTLYSAQCCP